MSNGSVAFDVVVVGGGVAGLCAAIAAHDAGASVVLLEASANVGGTASWSGGARIRMAFLGHVPVQRNPGRAAVLAYMKACAGGQADERLYTAFVDQAAGVVDYLERATPLRLEMGTMPDYQGGIEGGMYARDASRSMAPAIFDLNRLGERRALLRRSPYGTVPFSFKEFARFEAMLHPERIDAKLFGERLQQGYVGWGEALTAALFAGAIERGIDVRVDTRAVRLSRNGRVTGVITEAGGTTTPFVARRGVVLATGGFEWDPEIVARHFPGVKWTPSTVPTNRGDGWRMAEQAGASMGNEGACWGWPSYLVPGEVQQDSGVPLVRTSLVERCLPHCILVNQAGERFVDESLPYHTIQKTLIARTPDGRFPNLPAWHLFDQQFRDKYAFGPVNPGDAAPPWMHPAGSLDQLAGTLSIPAARLTETLARFNADVRGGGDRQFHRGTQPYGRFWGDPDNAAGPCLGTLEKPPFYAVEVIPSTLGTCSGPRIDASGRVLGANGTPIPGLFAAGNVTAAVSGPSYFGPGGTIGPAMVFGVLGGRAAAATGV